MRRYRIEHWTPDRRAMLERVECTASEFDVANDRVLGWDGVLADVPLLTTGRSVTLGGGAAPITVILCIEE